MFADELNSFIMRVSVLSIARLLLDNILPKGPMRSSAGKVIGLCVLICIAEPLILLLGMRG